MVIAKIPIKGVIGSYIDPVTQQEVVGVQLVDVATMIHAAVNADVLEVEIDSPGGDCDLGYEIYDLLVNTGKVIKTIIVGECCSIATVILLAGQTRQIGKTGKKPMIHNPWMQGVSGDANALTMAAAEIQEEEDKLVKFYSKHTGVEQTILSSLMRAETYMSVEQAYQFKFLTTPATFQAVAFKQTKDMSNKILAELNKLTKHFGLAAPATPEAKKALSITDDTGVAYETNSVGDLPVVGDTMTVAGEPAPDGTYSFADMQLTITVAGGLITAVEPIQAAADGSAEVASLKLALANSEKENATLKAKMVEVEAAESETVKTLQAINARANTYEPPKRAQVFARQEGDGKTEPANRLSKMGERRASYKKKK